LIIIGFDLRAIADFTKNIQAFPCAPGSNLNFPVTTPWEESEKNVRQGGKR
jgi:hypothetical protein